MERIYKTVLVTKPAAHCFQELRKSVDRQAAMIAIGISASSAKQFVDQMRDFTDEDFNLVLTNASTAMMLTKAVIVEELTSADLTMQILKAKYAKE